VYRKIFQIFLVSFPKERKKRKILQGAIFKSVIFILIVFVNKNFYQIVKNNSEPDREIMDSFGNIAADVYLGIKKPFRDLLLKRLE